MIERNDYTLIKRLDALATKYIGKSWGYSEFDRRSRNFFKLAMSIDCEIAKIEHDMRLKALQAAIK